MEMDAHEPPPPPPLYTRRTHPHPPPPPPHSRELVGYGFFMSHPETAPQCYRDPDHSNMHILFNIEGRADGLNSMLEVEHSHTNQLISKVPTLIIGMDVCHDVAPSLAAVVHSRRWPHISEYRGYVQTLSPEVEMIDSLHKPVSECDGKTRDSGIMRELLQDFCTSSGNRKPEQIIIFRYGDNEFQLTQVLNAEVDLIMKACKCFDEKWTPKFLVIKFLKHGPHPNVTTNGVKLFDEFRDYLTEHASNIDTTMPSQYCVLLNQVGCLSAEDLQELVDSLSYLHQLRTYAISLVAWQWCGLKTTEIEEPKTKRTKTEIELHEVNLERVREFIRDGEELALYALGDLNARTVGKYNFERYLSHEYGRFGIDIPSMKLWQHVSMFAIEVNGDKKIIFAELCYSDSEGKYESIVHSVLDPNERSGITYGCGICFPNKRGPNPTPHPADRSKYVVGHWAYVHKHTAAIGFLPRPPKSD